MEILIAINKILDIKIVQYALIVSLMILCLLYGLLCFKYETLSLERDSILKELISTAADLKVQNNAIAELGEKSKILIENRNRSLSEASRFKLQSDKILGAIAEYGFTGECDSKVTQTLRITKDGFKQYSGVGK